MDVSSQNPTKMLTFLGKGGSGKTTSAVFAAQVCVLEGGFRRLILINCLLGFEFCMGYTFYMLDFSHS